MYKKIWLYKFLFLSLFMMFLLILINFILDPFQQYRKATLYKPMYDNERYLNPGLVKTYNFTDVIIGSSMTENIILSETSTYLKYNKPLKLSMSGISAHETKIMLETAFENNKKIQNVLYGLDFFSFVGKPTRLFGGDNSLPLYLYDDNILNDYKYLLNIDTTKTFLNSRIDQRFKKHQSKFEFNKMYQWQHMFKEKDFSKKKLLALWNKRTINKETYFKYNELKNSFDFNIIPIIKNNPHCKFTIYFTPYSVLAFKNIYLNKELNTILDFKKYIITTLLKFSNVKVFDYQLDKSIVFNLDYYRDFNHHHQKINTEILKKISNLEFLIDNLATYKRLQENFYNEIKNYKVTNEKN